MRKKDRIRVVLDTSVLVRAVMNPQRNSASARVLQLWAQRRLQLIVSKDILDEYLAVLERLSVGDSLRRRLAQRSMRRETVTSVNLGRRFTESRDPDDNVFLSTALAGRARYVLTNDSDLLAIPSERLRGLRVVVMTPAEFIEKQRSPENEVRQ